VFIDCSDPGMENLVPVGEYKVAKTGECSDRRIPLIVTSDKRSLLICFGGQPPRPRRNYYTRKIRNQKMRYCVCIGLQSA